MSNNKSRSNKPYDSSNSFVKKVASRVSGLLSGWFAPNTGSDQIAVNCQDEASNDEEHFQDALEKPPPSKRLKLNASEPFIDAYPRCSTTEQGEGSSRLASNNLLDTSAIPGPSGIGARTSGFIASTPSVTSILEPKANGDDCSESGESTSGCSSLEPQMTRGLPCAPSQSRHNESLSPRKRLRDEKLNYSYLQNSRSLFLDRSASSLNNQTVGRRTNPSFCVNTFGTPLFGERGSINDLILNSPFYAGRTTYGGASSASYRRSLGSASLSSSPANSEKLGRHTIKVKPGNTHSTEDSSMSQTAKRILATLEQFSTPILDAKRIPVAQEPILSSLGSRKRSRVYDPGNSSRVLEQPRVPKRSSNKPMHWAKGVPNTSQLTIPVTPDTLILRRRDIVHESAPGSSTNTDTYKLRTESDENSRTSLKMKPPRHSDREPKGPQIAQEVNLPEVPLTISSLPTIDISVPAPNPEKSSSVSSAPTYISPLNKPLPVSRPLTSSTSSPTTQPFKISSEVSISDASFSFASPISVLASASTSTKDQPLTPVNNFTFSKPIPASLKFAEPSANCVKARPRAQPNLSSSGIKIASELKTGSVMDILGKSSNNASKNILSSGSNSLMDKFKPAAGTWECDKCLIRNKSDLTKCAACSNPRESTPNLIAKVPPEAKTSAAVATGLKSDSDFGAQFKLSQGKWECSACMVRNQDADSICVSCSTPKPGSVAAKPVAPAASMHGWGDKFKPPSNTWECNVCMVRNGPELSACQSCTTKKPGSSVEPVPPVKSSWGDKFKPPSNTWECNVCMVRNGPELTACQSCTTKKPGSSVESVPPVKSSWGDQFKKPEGSWTCNDCMVTNKAADSKCLACSAVKPGSENLPPSLKQAPKFSFGIPSVGENGSSTPAFTFGVPKDTKEATEKDKSNVSSSTGFKFGSSKPEASAATFSFGVPPSSTPVVPASTNKDPPSSSASVPAAGQSSSPLRNSSSSNPLVAVKPADVPPTQGSTLGSNTKPVFSFGAPPVSQEKTSTPSLFSFSKSPAPAAVTSQPASSTVSPLGGKRKFGDDTPSSSAVPMKFNIGSDQPPAVSLPKPEVTTTSSVSSTSGPIFSFSSASSSASSSAAVLFNTTVTSSANGQSTSDVAKTTSSSMLFSGVVSSPTSSSTAPKPTVTFGVNVPAKDESVSSTCKPSAPVASPEDNIKSDSTSSAGVSKPSFSFGSNVSSSGMAFGSSTNPGTATFSFGASADKTAATNKPTFGSPASSTTLFGSVGAGTANSTSAAPTFGSTSSSGFGSLTTSANSPQTFTTPNFSISGAPNFSASFNVGPDEKKPAFSFNSTSEPKRSGFAFSAPTETNKSFSFGAPEESKKGPFSFTAANPTTTQTSFPSQPASVFTFGASTTPAPNGPDKAPFAFGGSSQASTFPSFNPQPATSGFNFGAAAPTFGTPTNNAVPTFDGSTMFQQSQPQPPTFSSPFSAPSAQPQGAFNFSAPGSTNFGAQSQNPSASFSFGSNTQGAPAFGFTPGTGTFQPTPDAPGSRVIRKAARRKKI